MSEQHLKIKKGLYLTPQSAHPPSPVEGDLYFNTALGLQLFRNGIWQSAGGGGQELVIAGESFLSNTSYLVRWAIDGETEGRVYKADASIAATSGKHIVYAILLSTAAVSAGDSLLVRLVGSHDLGTSDTPFASADIGKALYLSDSVLGGFSMVAPSAVGSAQARIGVIESTSKISMGIKELDNIVPVPTYDEEIYYPTGLAANTPVSLPVNTRNGSLPQTYSPSYANLKVFVNSRFARQGTDWTSLSSSSLQFPFDLPNDTRVVFRIDPTSSGVLSGGGGGGSGSLQDSYDNGSSITIASGVPVSISGPPGQKLLQVNGDVSITGLLDPTGLQLILQSTTPLASGQYGIWMNNAKELMVTDTLSTSTNITQRITTLESNSSNTVILKTYLNNTGSTIPAFSPVYSPVAGQIALADGSSGSTFRVIGLTMTAIAPAASGNVAVSGIIPGISGLTHNTTIYLGLAAGSKTDIEPATPTYPVGFHIVSLGIMEGSNLILQIGFIAVL